MFSKRTPDEPKVLPEPPPFHPQQNDARSTPPCCRDDPPAHPSNKCDRIEYGGLPVRRIALPCKGSRLNKQDRGMPSSLAQPRRLAPLSVHQLERERSNQVRDRRAEGAIGIPSNGLGLLPNFRISGAYVYLRAEILPVE